MWVSTMGQKSIKTTQLPDVQNVIVSKQYIGGSLFKSQNGTIWTQANQDLTFKLRKAKFVNSGNVRFYNTPIDQVIEIVKYYLQTHYVHYLENLK